MARNNLSQAAAQRRAKKAADQVAKKTTKTPAKTSAIPVKSTESGNDAITPKKSAPVSLTGLNEIEPNQIASTLPQFNGDAYLVADPLNPPESLPQISLQDYEVKQGIYEGAIRAVKLTGTSFDLARERFVTEGKRTKAFSAGVKYATDAERAKGDFLDYQVQIETNQQKQINLGLAQAKTVNELALANYSEQEMAEKLTQSEVSLGLAQSQTQEKQNQLDEFRKRLGALTK
ncbi:hypothetical protein [Coleofasciculus sp. E1-EBD-02]|uniref:hypothetical protein n=1 Tax=Coleofasciculus sp. E1-EBD-02 TaxID=3068481 RepID=UPI0032F837DC